MGTYDVMQVCENGHLITDNYNRSPEFRKDFCTTCGAPTTTKCPNCHKQLKGDYHIPGVLDMISGPTPVPDICEYCGVDLPWKSKKKQVKENIRKADRDEMLLIDTICERFHIVVAQLRKRYDSRETLDVKDEYDVQDLLHSMLRVYFDDIRKEEWNPSYAGASSRSDFVLKAERIVIEVKMTRKGLKAKEIGEQLIIDKAKYKVHPDCKMLYCFVYDPEGYVDNPRGLENDLKEKSKDFEVEVRIVPKGH